VTEWGEGDVDVAQKRWKGLPRGWLVRNDIPNSEKEEGDARTATPGGALSYSSGTTHDI